MMLSYLFLLINIFPIIPTTTGATAPAYTATDFILLNCGEPSNMNDTSNRSWDGDHRSRYAQLNAESISSAFPAFSMHSSVSEVPYKTARVFNSTFTYNFPVLNGPKFVRLYFYPDIYNNLHTNQSYFSITANGFTLLSNFSAFLNSPSSDNPAFMKEFLIVVQENQRLNLTFSPNQNSFAFINGIEIVSLPDILYFQGNDVGIKFVDQWFYLKNDTALENVYRLNVGGSRVEIQDDSGPVRGMFRSWTQDDGYILLDDYGYTPHAQDEQIKYTKKTPQYSAPDIVYKTSRVIQNGSHSLNWGFPVDTGFYYLLRLHFCEIQLEVTLQNQRVFAISINNQTAEYEMDVIYLTGGTEIPIFKDYITWVPDDGRRGKKRLLLSLFPNMEGRPKYYNALLNGLEIFKLSDSDRSLAGGNPDPASETIDLPAEKKKKIGGSSIEPPIIYAVVGSLIGVALGLAVTFLIFRRRRKAKDTTMSDAVKSSWVPLSIASRSTTRTNRSGVSLPSDLCRHFLLDEIKTATGNFDSNFIIGKGGFGNVYKGFIDDGATAVAIKRLNPLSKQGEHEFLTEIKMLSKLRHLHLVSLIGYCADNGEMILVYDYMSHGTLRDHLYNSYNPPLTWMQRLQICLGSARGLHYLHTGAKQSIIHRDVKSTNILLDEKWVAKVSDFGLSKVGPDAGAHHVSTVVKGSFGYMDPEYWRRQQLTDKSDVYSFGVVLFEVLCARPAIIPRKQVNLAEGAIISPREHLNLAGEGAISLPKEHVNLAEWAKFCYKEKKVEQIIDSNLKGQIAPECLRKFTETAITCLKDKGIDRPAMSDVVWSLEFAIQLQEEAERKGDVGDDGGESFPPVSSSAPLLGNVEATTTDDDIFSRSSETVSGSTSSGISTDTIGKYKPEEVFSEIKNPVAR